MIRTVDWSPSMSGRARSSMSWCSIGRGGSFVVAAAPPRRSPNDRLRQERIAKGRLCSLDGQPLGGCMHGADAVARILKLEGVDYLFSYPNHPLIDAAARVGIRPIIARGEKTLINI